MIAIHRFPVHKAGCHALLGIFSVVGAEINGVVELGKLLKVSGVMTDLYNEHTLRSSK